MALVNNETNFNTAVSVVVLSIREMQVSTYSEWLSSTTAEATDGVHRKFSYYKLRYCL